MDKNKIIQIRPRNQFAEFRALWQIPQHAIVLMANEEYVNFVKKLPIEAIEKIEPELASLLVNTPENEMKYNISNYFLNKILDSWEGEL